MGFTLLFVANNFREQLPRTTCEQLCAQHTHNFAHNSRTTFSGKWNPCPGAMEPLFMILKKTARLSRTRNSWKNKPLPYHTGKKPPAGDSRTSGPAPTYPVHPPYCPAPPFPQPRSSLKTNVFAPTRPLPFLPYTSPSPFPPGIRWVGWRGTSLCGIREATYYSLSFSPSLSRERVVGLWAQLHAWETQK